MHGDRFRAHARKFKHELLLYTMRIRTVYCEKTILACRARARKTMVNKQIYITCARNLAPNTYAPCARTNRKDLKRVRRRAQILIFNNGSKLAVAVV